MADDDPFLLKRPHAALDWTDGEPHARDAGDIYFSTSNGLEEARAVFLAGAGFPARYGKSLTVVGELGFGTGLNFLALWDDFRRHAPPGSRLHFVSVEGFPLAGDDVRRALSAFPEVAALADALIAAWPSPHKGAHRRVFEGGRVTLTVFHDEAEAALAQMDFAADAWFLDGFAPAKNPAMWTPALLCEIARLSRPGAPAATFTVAGAVRRALMDAGFTVEKKPGFARKRERLEAIYGGPAHRSAPSPLAPAARLEGPLAIIGGGIAAASLVEALRRRGRSAEVFANGGWAAGASAAPLGLLTPRLEAADRPQARALLNAFDYAAELYARLGVFDRTGVLRTGDDGPARRRLQRLGLLLDARHEWLEAETARDRTGSGGEAGLFMAGAGLFRPADVVAALAGGEACVDARITRLDAVGDGWWLHGQDGRSFGPYACVILAGGHEIGALSGLAIEASAGRLGVFESATVMSGPVAWGGYAAPYAPGQLLIGATHLKGDDPGEPDTAETALRALAAAGAPDLALGAQVDSWGGVRAALADRLPVCGPTPGERFADQWCARAKGAEAPDAKALSDRAGILALGALGARGFAHAPLLAEDLASRLCGDPSALEQDGAHVLHPARFAWRALKRGR